MPITAADSDSPDHAICALHCDVGRSPRFATLALPATAGQAHAVRHWSAHALTRWGLSGTELDDALLVIAEFAANAAEHGGADMSIALIVSGNMLRVTVSDNGTARPDEIVPGDGAVAFPDESDTHGRGLILVEALALTWEASALHGGGVVLSAELPVHLCCKAAQAAARGG